MAPYLRLNAPPGRLIFVGDVHGCHEELLELLARLDPGPRDSVISVGDIVRKGPAGDRCLDLWRERGYLAVQGNNEIKLLRESRPLLRLFAREPVLRRGDLLRFIRSWPLVIDIPDAGIAAVHGGFLPGMKVTAEQVQRHRDEIVELRWIRRRNDRWKAVPRDERKDGDILWTERWNGGRFVVYGHTPVREPKLEGLSLGLDTGCVYGGRLTAAAYADGQWSFESVKARRKYAD